MSDRGDDSVERLRRAATEIAERDVLEARPPGLADVIARARALDPVALDEEAIATASRIDDMRERPVHGGPRDPLAAFIAAARKLAEIDVREREAEGVPPRRTSMRPTWVVAAAVAFAVAAAVVIAAGVTQMRSMRVDDPRGSQAAASVERDETADGIADELAQPPRPTPPRREPAPSELSAAPLEPPDPPAANATAKTKRPSPDSQLRALADEAEAALRRGELARADELLTRLIAIGGRHRLVELAYGDRFTIAHRSGIIGEQTKLWRAYLGKFPRGRFADDARAGLCRHAKRDASVDCWQDYLGDFPKGAYRGLAQRAIEEADGP
ncbi:MAG TPA: hypothetical protein VFG69_01675 [Nannocystaceae bacterium]|nr:hypothetical protein [Nannocystaceae bacterium]